MSADVTIVIPTRERADYLRVALHSVLASAAEAAVAGITTRVLVVDDASPTDATRRLCGELGVDCERIEVHSGQNDPAAAIVRGVSLVDGTWYSLFGDDDVMLPRFIRAHVEALRSGPGADVCSSAYLRTDAELRTTQEKILPQASLGDLLEGRVTINDGAMTRTDLTRDLPWDPTLAQQVLFPIWCELLFRGARFTRLVEPTFLYRRHVENISDRVGEAEVALRMMLAARYLALVLEQDGTLPAPATGPASAAVGQPGPPSRPTPKQVPPRWRRAASRLKRAVRRH